MASRKLSAVFVVVFNDLEGSAVQGVFETIEAADAVAQTVDSHTFFVGSTILQQKIGKVGTGEKVGGYTFVHSPKGSELLSDAEYLSHKLAQREAEKLARMGEPLPQPSPDEPVPATIQSPRYLQ